MSRVLIAYASKHGSTKETADAIAGVIRERGVEVQVAPVKSATVDGASAVIVAAPLYIGQLLKGTGDFLERNRAALEKLPVAVFALGPLRPTDDMEASRAELGKALEKWPWFNPVSQDVFIGVYDPDSLKFPESLVKLFPASPLKDVPKMDNRDWDAIKAWAAKVPEVLGLQAPATE